MAKPKIYEEVEALKLSAKHYGASIGVFGGSLSKRVASQAAKDIWKRLLNCTIVDYGKDGAGFSLAAEATLDTNIQRQVEAAGSHDVYILWASSNDFTKNCEVGTYKDYTYLDEYDETKRNTQCGGINYCIKSLTDRFPTSYIYLFTSTRIFSIESGYNPASTATNSLGYTFDDYLHGQIQCCGLYNIPYLNQYDIHGVNILNKDTFYTDNVHINELGYTRLGYAQAHFLAQGR